MFRNGPVNNTIYCRFRQRCDESLVENHRTGQHSILYFIPHLLVDLTNCRHQVHKIQVQDISYSSSYPFFSNRIRQILRLTCISLMIDCPHLEIGGVWAWLISLSSMTSLSMILRYPPNRHPHHVDSQYIYLWITGEQNQFECCCQWRQKYYCYIPILTNRVLYLLLS